jgi:blue copper oxidase
MSAHDESSTVNRRDFVRIATVSAGTLAVGGGAALLGACDRAFSTHEHGVMEPALAKGGGGGAAARNPLHLPGTVSPAGLTLNIAPGSADLGGGRSTNAYLYNGRLPGPTIVAARGSHAAITLQNGLPQETITHWHGMLVDHLNDGHPHQARPPGGSYAYSFPVEQRACLNWYHAHPHGKTGEQVYMGLAGAFIIRDADDTGASGNRWGLPADRYEVPLIIRDASFDSRGNFSFSSKSSGFFGNTPLVNGTLNPTLAVDRAFYRFRVLNGCNARVLRLALSNGAPFMLIGNEGGLLGSAASLHEITAGPGERFDVLVDFRMLAQNAAVVLRCLAAGWDLLEFRGTGSSVTSPVPASSFEPIPTLSNPVRTRNFSFDGMTRINGKVYDMHAVEFTVPFGETERWVFRTNGNGPHPVHVHGAYFQVQSRSGGRGRVFDWERGWKDTVLVNDKETVDVLIRFTAHRGLYLIHCHQLAHEDNGMMANFEVV